MSEERLKNLKKLTDIQKTLGSVFAGEGGVFERSLFLAIKGWNRSSPFTLLDIGCGGGQSQVPLIKLAVEKVKEVQKDAKIIVYQMDYIGDEEAQKQLNGPEAVRKSASSWLEENVDSFFIAQSYYDPYDFSKAVRTDGKDENTERNHESVKVNLLFSQSSLHWVPDLQPLSMDHFRSNETREYSKSTYARILNNMIPSVCDGGVIACHHMGILDEKVGWGQIEHTVVRYILAFESGFQDEEEKKEKFLSEFLPQIPRRLDDIIELFQSKKEEGIEIIETGRMKNRPFISDDKITPEFAKVCGKSMVGMKMWRDRYQKLFPGDEDEENVFQRAAECVSQKILNEGFHQDYCIVYYVLLKKK